jgi:hypothetical protein
MSDSLEAKVKALEKQVQTLQDIEDIQKLEYAYAYYIEHLMYEETGDCWTEDGQLVWLGLGIFKGRQTIKDQWKIIKKHFEERGETRHMGARFSPYIVIAPDGKTATGRWYVAGGSMGASMLCENTYVKKNGVWMIDVMSVGGFPFEMPGAVDPAAATSAMGPDAKTDDKPSPGPKKGMTPADEEKATQEYMGYYPFTERISRVPRQEYGPYLRPFSFKHPVTGKDVNKTVEAWNKAHPCPMPPGGEKWMEKSKKK